MRAVIQRVSRASVTVDGHVAGQIGPGFLVLIGMAEGDGPADIEYVSTKVRDLRVFDDGEGRLNLSLKEAGGSVLVVSQFTLLGDVRKGRRPSYDEAAKPEAAEALYLEVIARLRSFGLTVEAGVFRAHMHVELVNDGPVTILIDSRRTF